MRAQIYVNENLLVTRRRFWRVQPVNSLQPISESKLKSQLWRTWDHFLAAFIRPDNHFCTLAPLSVYRLDGQWGGWRHQPDSSCELLKQPVRLSDWPQRGGTSPSRVLRQWEQTGKILCVDLQFLAVSALHGGSCGPE